MGRSDGRYDWKVLTPLAPAHSLLVLRGGVCERGGTWSTDVVEAQSYVKEVTAKLGLSRTCSVG